MVSATFNGRSELLDVSIESEVVNKDDIQMLQDLIRAAVNDGLVKVKQLSQSEMGKLTGGINIPGLF